MSARAGRAAGLDLDWVRAAGELDDRGSAVLEGLLSPEECRSLAALYQEDAPFRCRIEMARHGFGRGELLQYQPEDFTCLHQDLYGEHVFPLQLAVLLSEPGRDFTGGEFVMTEQRPRMQSRVEVVPLRQGDGVLFAVSHRPVWGNRGSYRVNLRHGVSPIRSGRRHTVGIIFHDAR
jgi:hypothetical protein